VRIHGPLVSDEEVESIAQSLREHGGPRYVDGIGDMIFGGATAGADIAHSGEDDLFSRAAAVVLRDRKASTSHIQRRLSIGYNRAADLMERLELEGLVSAPNHMGRREVLGGDRTGFAASA
jgi:S-DNA-T family DNA segregation ATPase FtsK/SpoIIIE